MPKQVRVANGEVMISDSYVPQLTWWCDGHTIQTDMRVLNLGAFDAILGYDWPASHSPMTCHWHNKTMEFLHHEQLVQLQGITPPAQGVQSLSASQLLKWHKGNDIWACVLIFKDKEDQLSSTRLEI